MKCRHCETELSTLDLSVGKIDECRDCADEVERYAGHMIWDHKTAPVIEIHASASSVAALKDGRYNEGLKLVREVKERSRRREGDTGDGSVSHTPYNRETISLKASQVKAVTEVVIRHGRGKTHTSFSRSDVSAAKIGRRTASIDKMGPDKLALLRGCAKLRLNRIAGTHVTVWKDELGFYTLPARTSQLGPELDHETRKNLGFRGTSFTR
jgi:hypothetical protein